MSPYSDGRLERRLNKVRDRILKHRNEYVKAAERQLSAIMFLSLDGQEAPHTKAMEELETALTLLWRFDRKLQEANALEALLEQLDGNESSTGSTG